ncbi:hypothetical protein [Lacrimispora sp.]|uniref:hypothetical protein n=1 Tax=Lacrimispora sp. TaxID=2719234 RepID=UPI003460EC90
MSEQITKTLELLEMLPEADQLFAYEFVKKLVLAWDPDYTKLTAAEKTALENALNDNSSITHEELMKELGL